MLNAFVIDELVDDAAEADDVDDADRIGDMRRSNGVADSLGELIRLDCDVDGLGELAADELALYVTSCDRRLL